jgi:hypothetical protein
MSTKEWADYRRLAPFVLKVGREVADDSWSDGAEKRLDGSIMCGHGKKSLGIERFHTAFHLIHQGAQGLAG